MKRDILTALFETLEQSNMTMADFSRETSIPRDRVYQWRRGRGKPKGTDSEKITTWIASKAGEAAADQDVSGVPGVDVLEIDITDKEKVELMREEINMLRSRVKMLSKIVLIREKKIAELTAASIGKSEVQ